MMLMTVRRKISNNSWYLISVARIPTGSRGQSGFLRSRLTSVPSEFQPDITPHNEKTGQTVYNVMGGLTYFIGKCKKTFSIRIQNPLE